MAQIDLPDYTRLNKSICSTAYVATKSICAMIPACVPLRLLSPSLQKCNILIDFETLLIFLTLCAIYFDIQ
jgi:hypothetical protein